MFKHLGSHWRVMYCLGKAQNRKLVLPIWIQLWNLIRGSKWRAKMKFEVRPPRMYGWATLTLYDRFLLVFGYTRTRFVEVSSSVFAAFQTGDILSWFSRWISPQRKPSHFFASFGTLWGSYNGNSKKFSWPTLWLFNKVTSGRELNIGNQAKKIFFKFDLNCFHFGVIELINWAQCSS